MWVPAGGGSGDRPAPHPDMTIYWWREQGRGEGGGWLSSLSSAGRYTTHSHLYSPLGVVRCTHFLGSSHQICTTIQQLHLLILID